MFGLTPETTPAVSTHNEAACTNSKPPRPRKPPVCYHYKRGNCRNGVNCQFRHPVKTESQQFENPNQENAIDNSTEVQKQENESAGKTVENTSTEKTVDKKKSRRVCHYFLRGTCRNGENCLFRHPKGPKPDGGNEKARIQPQKALPVDNLQVDNLSADELARLRQVELTQMQKRFPKGRFNVDTGVCEVTFLASDPDWPYDVKHLDMVVVLPAKYPLEPLKFQVSEEQLLPSTLIEHVEHEVRVWLTDRYVSQQTQGRVELVFRPLLRWLDRNLETIFTNGLKEVQKEVVAKAAGLEFIPHWKLRKPDSENEAGEGDENDEEAEVDDEGENDEESEDEESDDDNIDDFQAITLDEKRQKPAHTEPSKTGTEIKLKHLQLQDGAGWMLATRIRLVLHCSRCKTDHDLQVPSNRLSSVTCHKCRCRFLVRLRPAMLHQYADVLGYLDLEGCLPVDLVLADCQFTLGCSDCQRDMVKQQLAPGSVHDRRCHGCHARLRVAVETARFYQLEPGAALDVKTAQALGPRSRKTKTDTVVREGYPLPDEGTCKHYKKSYRWFRFPCCGKVYPCDLCHEEKKADGHEMIFANRMICGHCSREQGYAAEKPCVACKNSLTRSAGSAYWEGGKGCRDKIKMNRNDSHKYQNTNRTLSKTTQKKSEQQKRTKPRHS